MKVKDIWYYHYGQKESEVLQPDLVTPESHVGIYCEFEELVFPVSFHVLGKKRSLFQKTEKRMLQYVVTAMRLFLSLV